MVTKKDLIGDIEGFPIEVVEKILERFQECRYKGFDWEGKDFWSAVIKERDFDVFFKRYPIPLKEDEQVKAPYPKKMYVSDTGDLTNKEAWHEAIVLLETEGKFLAVDKDSSIDTTMWNYAIDKWRYNQMKEPKKEVLHNALNASDFVLVRDKKENVWMLEIFSHMNYENAPYPFICLRDNYTFCIPFKGNEHLLNTNKNEM